MSLLKRGLRLLPFRSITGLAAARNVVAPCYHIVSDDSPAHVRHLFRWRGVQAFRRELDLLLRHFQPLSLDDVHRSLAAGQPLPERSVFLSFDDGFREMSDVVAPLCREKGIPATFFLTTGFLDNRILGYRHKASLLVEAFQHRGAATRQAATARLARKLGAQNGMSTDWRRMLLSVKYGQREVLDECAEILEVDFAEYLERVRPYLTLDQVHQMVKAGFSIGGHSIDHPKYSDLSLEEQISQTAGCMEMLDREFRLSVKAFAFPFVSDGITERYYDELVLRRIVDLSFCIGQMPRAHQAVQRFGVEAEKSYSLRDLLAMQAEGRLRQKASIWKRRILIP